jgi:hypothetical protein
MRLLLLLVALGADPGLGPPLRQDGYHLRPPGAFHMARLDLFHGTHAGGICADPAASRYLSAALVDGDTEEASSLLISIVEAPMELGPSARDELSTAVVRHFRDALGLSFALERTQVVSGSRVEVLGAVKQGSQLRRVLVAAFPSDARHAVVLASVPSARWEALAGPLKDSLDTFGYDTPVNVAPSRRAAWAFAGGMGSLLLLSLGLWRRRQSRHAETG